MLHVPLGCALLCQSTVLWESVSCAARGFQVYFHVLRCGVLYHIVLAGSSVCAELSPRQMFANQAADSCLDVYGGLPCKEV
jgi:hypothetical protein